MMWNSRRERDGMRRRRKTELKVKRGGREKTKRRRNMTNMRMVKMKEGGGGWRWESQMGGGSSVFNRTSPLSPIGILIHYVIIFIAHIITMITINFTWNLKLEAAPLPHMPWEYLLLIENRFVKLNIYICLLHISVFLAYRFDISEVGMFGGL